VPAPKLIAVPPRKRQTAGKPLPPVEKQTAEQIARTQKNPPLPKSSRDPLGGWGVEPAKGPMSETERKQQSARRRNQRIDRKSVFNRSK
jgi:hypothetical protein